MRKKYTEMGRINTYINEITDSRTEMKKGVNYCSHLSDWLKRC